MKEEEQEIPKANHILIPTHEKLSDKEKKEILTRYCITIRQLPKIPFNDPALAGLNVKAHDVIKITRLSPTAGKTYFYRGVSSD